MVVKTARKPTAKAPVTAGEPRRFTAEEFERMDAAGILRPDEHIELLDGAIVHMASKTPRHAAAVTMLGHAFIIGLDRRARTRSQCPIRVTRFSEPLPDIALVHVRDDEYENGHPEPAEIYLLAEVADTSLRYDQERKLPLYLRAGILESWIVDLHDEGLFAYRSPQGDRYLDIATYKRGDHISPLAFPDFSLAMDDIRGPVKSA